MAMRDRMVQCQRLFAWTWGLTPKTLAQARSRHRKDLTADVRTVFAKDGRTLEDGTVRVGHWCEICRCVLPHIHTSSLHGVRWCLTCGLVKEIWQRKRCVVCRFNDCAPHSHSAVYAPPTHSKCLRASDGLGFAPQKPNGNSQRSTAVTEAQIATAKSLPRKSSSDGILTLLHSFLESFHKRIKWPYNH
jgi:hypothetical protein